jgi:Ca-activated chloride channel homolog
MFVYPAVLILLFVIPLAMLFFAWRMRVHRIMLQRIGNRQLIDELIAQHNPARRRWKSLLWLFTIALLIVALARPVWGIHEDMVETEGIALIVVLDVSNSMNAQDVLPSRMDRAKLDARDLFELGRGNEVGLILFAGNAFVQFPLTSDVDSAVTFLNVAGTDSISRQGTALEDALRLAIETIDQRQAAQSVIVLMTDGESHEGSPLLAAEDAAQRGIIVHVIGYGSTAGASIPIYDDTGQVIGHKADRAGNVVVSRLDEGVLEEIAALTGGLYQRAADSGVEAVNLINQIATMQIDVLTRQTQTRKVERFSLFVFLAALALTVEIFLSERREEMA